MKQHVTGGFRVVFLGLPGLFLTKLRLMSEPGHNTVTIRGVGIGPFLIGFYWTK